ncbi:hypothetical protein [Hyalangium rubrum]|uniref:Uncharacterized protein n=1 Tax=Hyalangium rubrum TaxID=3103134 RepID=A0ABU5HD53_9BACT|nr:hypothetical protein [Hyalangium sp. s54d21]MDY7231392.1 hypothetical protein [Hyalangium sp. s54d21]
MSQTQRARPSDYEPLRGAVFESGVRPSRRVGAVFAVGVAAALVTVPLALGLGIWVGSLSSKTLVAAPSALLGVWVLPPLAVVAAEAWQGRRQESGRTRVGVPLAAALGVQLLVLMGAVLVGASAHVLGDAMLLTLVEAVLLPAVVSRTVWRAP